MYRTLYMPNVIPLIEQIFDPNKITPPPPAQKKKKKKEDNFYKVQPTKCTKTPFQTDTIHQCFTRGYKGFQCDGM